MQLHIEDYCVENYLANHNVQRKAISEIGSPQNKPIATKDQPRFQNIDVVDKTPRVDVIPETMVQCDYELSLFYLFHNIMTILIIVEFDRKIYLANK